MPRVIPFWTNNPYIIKFNQSFIFHLTLTSSHVPHSSPAGAVAEAVVIMPGAAEEWATAAAAVAEDTVEVEVVEAVVAAGTEVVEGMEWPPAATGRPLPATMIGEWCVMEL